MEKVQFARHIPAAPGFKTGELIFENQTHCELFELLDQHDLLNCDIDGMYSINLNLLSKLASDDLFRNTFYELIEDTNPSDWPVAFTHVSDCWYQDLMAPVAAPVPPQMAPAAVPPLVPPPSAPVPSPVAGGYYYNLDSGSISKVISINPIDSEVEYVAKLTRDIGAIEDDAVDGDDFIRLYTWPAQFMIENQFLCNHSCNLDIAINKLNEAIKKDSEDV